MLENQTAKQILTNNGYSDIIVFENPSYDSALIGVSSDDRAVYSYNKMIEYLVAEENMTEEDAADFISFNTTSSLGFPESPVVMYDLVE